MYIKYKKELVEPKQKLKIIAPNKLKKMEISKNTKK